MSDNPTGSETIVPEPVAEPEPVPEDPATTFRKGKAKREAKRKEVQVITTHVPAPEPVNPESIADRVAEILLSKMAVEKDDMVKTSPVKAKPRQKRAPKTPEEKPAPPATKFFGWC